ncbi:MAG TPA: hypothetical protein VG248_12400 [Caulobacteraceae bacterium]|jgi:hypothetical protein|nr:hypothetical protein [Caulobacteraceae bacterium]
MTRLLVICADGLDWPGCDPRRLSAVKAQRLLALRAGGAAGWLSGAAPGFGLAAAASLASGVQPELHGVWRAEEAWAGGVRPVGRSAWRVAPVWTRLEAAGVSTGSVGWPATRPGADWPGLHIDDAFAQPAGAGHDTWALPPSCAPAAVRESLRDRRVHPNQISPPMLAPFMPPGGAGAVPSGAMVETLRRAIAQAASVQAAAVWMVSEQEGPAPQAVFVHHPILKQARDAAHGAGPRIVEAVAAAGLRFVDGLIDRLAGLCGRDCAVLVVSPGWGAAAGVVMVSGLSTAPLAEGRSILDIAPTVLAVFGLEDRALSGASLVTLTPTGGMRAAPLPQAPAAMGEAGPARGGLTHRLRTLGYRPLGGPSTAWRAAGAAELATMLLDRDPQGALRVAEEALSLDEGCVMALRVKSRAHVALGEDQPLQAVGEKLCRLAPDRGWGAAAIGAAHVLRGAVREAEPWLKQAETESDVATLIAVGTLWTASGRLPEAERVFLRLIGLDPGNVTAEIGLALAASARRDFLTAEAGLLRAATREPGRAAIWLQLAQIYAATGRKGQAERAAARAGRLGAIPALAQSAAAGRLAPSASRKRS